MRKTIKRLGAVLLAMAMAVSVLCTGALATDTYSITVTNTTAGYTYQAYQIFAGTLGDKDTNKTETPHKSSKIIVVYSATVNENAIIGTDGNKNTVKLEYSNDPNWGGGENEPTGNTPESYVKVYSTGLKLQKIDGQTKAALTGAKFTIEGTTHQIGYTYRPSDSGTYYKQADGRYSTTVPENSENATKYERIASTAEQQKFTATAEVGSDGTLVIRGLGAGTYTITEIVAPTGYNLLKDPITITIAGTATNDGVTWTVKKDSESLSPDIKDNHLYLLQVQNNKGSTLPSTGGMGTKLFYTIGGILMAAAASVLVVRKRRSDAE